MSKVETQPAGLLLINEASLFFKGGKKTPDDASGL